MSDKSNQKRLPRKKRVLRRLVVANLIAALGLLTVAVTVLFFLGLLDTVFAFIF